MLIYVGAIAIFRSSYRKWLWAFLTVAVVELLNEGIDIIDWANGHAPPNWQGGLLDIAHTLCLPLLLTLLMWTDTRRGPKV